MADQSGWTQAPFPTPNPIRDKFVDLARQYDRWRGQRFPFYGVPTETGSLRLPNNEELQQRLSDDGASGGPFSAGAWRGGVYHHIPVPAGLDSHPDMPKLIKPLLRATPPMLKQQVDFMRAEPVIMSHKVDRHSAVPGTTHHRMEIGSVPPEYGQPLRLGEARFYTNPDDASTYVAWMNRDPRVLMSPGEFGVFRDKFEALLKSMGARDIHSAPLSESRNRMFKSMGARPEPISDLPPGTLPGWTRVP